MNTTMRIKAIITHRQKKQTHTHGHTHTSENCTEILQQSKQEVMKPDVE